MVIIIIIIIIIIITTTIILPEGGGGSVMWVRAGLGCKTISISYIRRSCSVWVSSLLSVLH